MSGVGGLKCFFTMFCAAFPNLSYTVDDEIAERDMVIQGVNWPLYPTSPEAQYVCFKNSATN